LLRCFSQQRRDLLRIELRALRDELLGDGGAGFFVREERLEGLADAGFGGELGEAEEFFVIRGAVELREQFGDAGGAGLRLQRERGKHAGLHGQFRGGFGVEELRDDIGMTLQEHADEEALELAVVGLAHGDLLRAAGGLDGGAVGEAGFGEGEQELSDVLIGQIPTDLTDLTELTAGEILLSGKMRCAGSCLRSSKLLPGEVNFTDRLFAERRDEFIRAELGEIGDL
jgi:hypothetical protein